MFCDELTGEFGNGLEKASVDHFGLLGPFAGNLSHPIFGVLQHYPLNSRHRQGARRVRLVPILLQKSVEACGEP